MSTVVDTGPRKHGHEIVTTPPTEMPGVPDTRLIGQEKAAKAAASSAKRRCQMTSTALRRNRLDNDKADARSRWNARSSTTQKSVKHKRRHILRIVKQLNIYLPLRRPVVVLTSRQLSKKDGDCCVIGRKFQIRVSKELPVSQAIDVLLHEWAHALSWDACEGKVVNSRRISDYEFDRLAHGPKWGIVYSRVYQCFAFEIWPCLQVEDFNAAILARMGRQR